MCKKIGLLKKYKEIDEKAKEIDEKAKANKVKILNELKDKNGVILVRDNIVKESKVCFIFSCPGEKEMVEQKPCAGETGENLESILELLHKKCSYVFRSCARYDYTIINASNHVHFELFDQKSEADDSEIKDEKNVKNKIKKLKKMKIKSFILCGNKAKILFDEMAKQWKELESPDYKKIQVCHLGSQGIRNKYPNSCKYNGVDKIESLEVKERDQKRFELIAEEIWEKINK